MTKPLQVNSLEELHRYKTRIEQNLKACKENLQVLLEQEAPFSLFGKMKYEKIGIEPLTGEAENIIEVINQAQTYLVSIKAAEYLLMEYPEHSFMINWGNIPGYDLESEDGSIIAEVFAATSYRSNGKLAADLNRLSQNTTAEHRYEFFYDREFSETNRTYYEGRYPDIKIIKFDTLY